MATAHGDRTHTTYSALSEDEASSRASARCQAWQGSGEDRSPCLRSSVDYRRYAGSSLASDLSGVHNSSILPYLLLGLALLVALGFEFTDKAQPQKLQPW
jgi:hypothetical protein